jgi:hypothetical protein
MKQSQTESNEPMGQRFPVRVKVEQAYAATEGNVLIVSSGMVERRWRWTGKGLVTVALMGVSSGREWADRKPAVDCDWEYPGWIDGDSPAILETVQVKSSDDDGFTSKHLEVSAEMTYPSIGLTVRYVIWAYPGATGLRTQLFVKGLPIGAESAHDRVASDEESGGRAASFTLEKRSDYLPLKTANLSKTAIGYYNDTQHRNTAATKIIREESVKEQQVDWASLFCLEDRLGGLVMVKESHKCVNQSGVDTGIFLCDDRGLSNTGWALSVDDLQPDRFQWCWATWVILYDGTADGREMAIKQYDRLRYPVIPERDMYSLVCTWGHCENLQDGMKQAQEKEVLPEMKRTAELGIDMLLIDAGWEVSAEAQNLHPDGGNGWKPHPQVYPEGWSNVARLKRELGLKLGLWGMAKAISLEEMKWNWDQIRMHQFKLDFANLGSYPELKGQMEKAREFIDYTGKQCLMSWDVTENKARYGYYWAREYGNVHFMNRKPNVPKNAVYIPWLALRDFWLLSKYNNLNKWQLTIHNPEVINRELSDAHRYSAAYCAATALMGIPHFMALPRFYSDRGSAEIQEMMALYKQHQLQIFRSFVFPIGEEPSNASWSGFQAYDPETQSGYATIFREIDNPVEEKSVALRFVAPGTTLKITDLRTGAERTEKVMEGNQVSFRIEQPGEFLFVRYVL